MYSIRYLYKVLFNSTTKKQGINPGFLSLFCCYSSPISAPLLDSLVMSRRIPGLWCGWWLLWHKRFRRSVRLYNGEHQVLRWRLIQDRYYNRLSSQWQKVFNSHSSIIFFQYHGNTLNNVFKKVVYFLFINSAAFLELINMSNPIAIPIAKKNLI